MTLANIENYYKSFSILIRLKNRFFVIIIRLSRTSKFRRRFLDFVSKILMLNASRNEGNRTPNI